MTEKYMIAVDMDGTLLNNKGKITERTLNTLKTLLDAGHYVVPASGRAFPILPEEIKSLSGIQYAILENGAVIEEGTHDSLMELGGKYAAMFTLQSQNYKERREQYDRK